MWQRGFSRYLEGREFLRLLGSARDREPEEVIAVGQKQESSLRKYVRPIDVVNASGLSKSTVMAALWSGELEAIRKGRSWLIPIDAVDRWIRGEQNAA